MQKGKKKILSNHEIIYSLCTRVKENYSLDRERFVMSQFGVSSGDDFLKNTMPRVAETYLEQLDSVSVY